MVIPFRMLGASFRLPRAGILLLCVAFVGGFVWLRWYWQRYLPAQRFPEELLTCNPTGILNATIITSFFNIGSFCCKTVGTSFRRTPEHYFKWSTGYGRILAPVVLYTDDDKFAVHFQRIRKNLPTKVIRANRSDLRSFQLIPKMKAILSHKFSLFSPHVYRPDYIAVMHSKYELIHKTVMENPFWTPWFVWADVGVLRYGLPYHNTDYQLQLPYGIQSKLPQVAFAEVSPFDANQSPQQIIDKTLVWVSGAVFVAKRDDMLRFTNLYMRVVDILLQQGMISTDQQVIYAAYTSYLRPKLETYNITIVPYKHSNKRRPAIVIRTIDRYNYLIYEVLKPVYPKEVAQEKCHGDKDT